MDHHGARSHNANVGLKLDLRNRCFVGNGGFAHSKPITRLILQTPSGLQSVEVQCAEGKVTQVTVENLPRFAAQLDVTLKVPGLGDVKVDTTFGRDSYVIMDAVDLGFEIQPHEAHHIVEFGLRITKATNDQLGCNHPVQPD